MRWLPTIGCLCLAVIGCAAEPASRPAPATRPTQQARPTTNPVVIPTTIETVSTPPRPTLGQLIDDDEMLRIDMISHLPDSKLPIESKLAALSACLHDQLPNVEVAALRAVSRLGEAGRPLLKDVLRLPDALSPSKEASAVTVAAIDALAELKSPTGDVLVFLIGAMNFGHGEEPVHAMRALGVLGDGSHKAQVDLLFHLQHNDATADEAAAALAAGPKGRSALVAELYNPPPEVERRILSALAARGSEAGPVVPALVEMFEKRNDPPSLEIADAILRIQPKNQEIRDALISIIGVPRTPRRTAAIELLERTGPANDQEITALAGAFRSTKVGDAALHCLLRVASNAPQAIARVQELLDSSDDDARRRAMQFLATGGPATPDALPVLLKLLRAGPSEMRGLAADDLGAMGPAAKPAIPALLDALHSAAPAVRGSAATALLQVDPSGTWLADSLLDAVKRKDYLLRVLLAPALRAPATRPANLVPALVELARHGEDDEVRANAYYALRDLGEEGR